MNRSIAAGFALSALMVAAPDCLFADVGLPNSGTPRQIAEAAGQADAITLAETWRRDLGARDLTISEIREILLSKSVRIGGGISSRGELLRWTFARKSGSRYIETDSLAHPPLEYRKLIGKIIAVELQQSLQTGMVNAFGETPADDAVKNPPFDVVVKFENSKVAIAQDYAGAFTWGDFITLTDERKAFAERIAGPVADLVGREVYATGFSEIYRIDTSLEELRDADRAAIKSLVGSSVLPLLRPLRIAGAKFLPDDDAVILKLVLPDGTEALGYNDNIASSFAIPSGGYSVDAALTNGLALRIPPEFTAREIEAIQDGSIFRGMSLAALEYAVGFPDSENDWGAGGKQLIYGRTGYVYVDADGNVTDWQILK